MKRGLIKMASCGSQCAQGSVKSHKPNHMGKSCLTLTGHRQINKTHPSYLLLVWPLLKAEQIMSILQ